MIPNALPPSPTCAVCKTPVESFTVEMDIHEARVFVAKCHGSTERSRIAFEEMQRAPSPNVQFAEAFSSEAPLKLTSPPNLQLVDPTPPSLRLLSMRAAESLAKVTLAAARQNQGRLVACGLETLAEELTALRKAEELEI